MMIVKNQNTIDNRSVSRPPNHFKVDDGISHHRLEAISGARDPIQSHSDSHPPPPIWWSNSIFFVSVHLLGIYGLLFISPIHRVSSLTLLLSCLSWQLATFGITIGYHRLWSHRSFDASPTLRWILVLLACLGFQGSVKWWVLRHRLHHRFTDTDSDPYNAKRGLFFSHMGWIFRKPTYEKLKLIDRTDIDRDRVVRFQHKYYLLLSLTLGFILPDILTQQVFKSNTNHRLDGLIWAGFISRLLIWHFTFFINSLAHYLGHQLYDLDITARSNFFLAIFTGGEANHNYHHVFPRDYRNGPATLDWDPSKWIIYLLYRYTPLITKIYFTPPDEIEFVRKRVLRLTNKRSSTFEDLNEIRLISSSSSSGNSSSSEEEEEEEITQTPNYKKPYSFITSSNSRIKLPRWKKTELIDHLKQTYLDQKTNLNGLLLTIIDGYLVNLTEYAKLGNHPGGYQILKKHSIDLLMISINNNDDDDEKNKEGIKKKKEEEKLKLELKDFSDEFYFKFNHHSWIAKNKMKSLRIAKLID